MAYIDKVLINYMQNPVVSEPQFSWIISSDRKNVMQTAYFLKIWKEGEAQMPVYSSGKIYTGQSAHVKADGFCMESLNTYLVSVKIWDNYGDESGWSRGERFYSALQSVEEWKAQFITAETEEDISESKGTYIRGNFFVEKPIRQAFMTATALGIYHPYLNGQKIGCNEMAPGWTAYDKRILYQTFEVTDSIREGENVVAAHVGPGWYKGTMGIDRDHNIYGKYAAFSAQILIRFVDGAERTIVTDQSFKGCCSPVLFSEIYDGETYDSRLEQNGWNDVGFHDAEWKRVQVIWQDKFVLAAQEGCTVKKMEAFPAKELIVTPQGDTVIDFGQNLSGWIAVKVCGAKGEEVVLNHFEVLDKFGNVYLDNLRTAKETTRYICNGQGERIYHPFFSFQGFRYVRVAAFPREIKKENFTAYAVYSDMEKTGWFWCSNPLLNQLNHNIEWGMNSNFLDIPTDCPQRDERLGWTGDAQVFCRTASYLRNTFPFFKKWLMDLMMEQNPEGAVPYVIPNVVAKRDVAGELYAAAAWADAAVIIPWTMYLMYGDKEIIRQQYGSMKGWIDFMTENEKDYIWSYKGQFGDWASLDAKEGECVGATPVELICIAYYAYSVELFVKMAKAIGSVKDAEKYSALYDKIKDSYQRHFISGGHVTVRTQTAQILTLYFHLAEDSDRQKIVKDLLQLLQEKGGHLTTGFVGTPYICQVLSENGCTEVAYNLLMKEDFPSWLYQVKAGATTVWEHWDGIKTDGTMWSPTMNSFNHYAYGAVGEWLYRGVIGIEADPDSPGFEHVLIRPHIGGGLTEAQGRYESIHGSISCVWKREKDTVTLNVALPANVTASVILEDIDVLIETEKEVEWKKENRMMTGRIGSGNYQMVFKLS